MITHLLSLSSLRAVVRNGFSPAQRLCRCGPLVNCHNCSGLTNLMPFYFLFQTVWKCQRIQNKHAPKRDLALTNWCVSTGRSHTAVRATLGQVRWRREPTVFVSVTGDYDPPPEATLLLPPGDRQHGSSSPRIM